MKIHVTIGLPVLYSDIILLNADTIDGTMILHNKFNSNSRPNRKYLELFDCGTDTEVGRRFTRLWTVSASLTFTDSNALKFLLHLLNTLKKMTKTFIFSFVTSYSVLDYIHLKLSNMKNKMGCLLPTSITYLKKTIKRELGLIQAMRRICYADEWLLDIITMYLF